MRHLHHGRDRGGLDAGGLRTTLVSLLSRQGVSIQEIARLAGHASTRTTEIVYRRELRPVIPPAPRSWTSSSQKLAIVRWLASRFAVLLSSRCSACPSRIASSQLGRVR